MSHPQDWNVCEQDDSLHRHQQQQTSSSSARPSSVSEQKRSSQVCGSSQPLSVYENEQPSQEGGSTQPFSVYENKQSSQTELFWRTRSPPPQENEQPFQDGGSTQPFLAYENEQSSQTELFWRTRPPPHQDIPLLSTHSQDWQERTRTTLQMRDHLQKLLSTSETKPSPEDGSIVDMDSFSDFWTDSPTVPTSVPLANVMGPVRRGRGRGGNIQKVERPVIYYGNESAVWPIPKRDPFKYHSPTASDEDKPSPYRSYPRSGSSSDERPKAKKRKKKRKILNI